MLRDDAPTRAAVRRMKMSKSEIVVDHQRAGVYELVMFQPGRVHHSSLIEREGSEWAVRNCPCASSGVRCKWWARGPTLTAAAAIAGQLDAYGVKPGWEAALAAARGRYTFFDVAAP